MGKLKFTLSNILFWVAIIASCLLLENVAFLSSDLTGGLDNTSFFLLFALAMVGYGFYFAIERIKNKVKLDYPLISALGTGFICALISILSFRSISFDSSDPAFAFSYSVDSWNQFKQILSLLVFLVSLYAVLFNFNKNYPSIRKLSLLFIIIMVICYVSIVYSLIAERTLYEAIFKNVETTIEMKSLFWNQNMFAGFLLMGIAASMGLNYFKKNPFSYISIPFFFVFIIFTGSLTSILIAIIGSMIYFIIEIAFTIKKKIALGILFLGILLIVSLGAYILFACATQVDMGNFSTFCNYLKQKIVAADYQTFTNRTFLWKASFELLKEHPLNLIFGFGFRNSQIILGGYKSADMLVEFAPISAHSGYVQVLMNFGLVGLTFYAGFIAYYFYCFVRLLKKDTRFALIYLIIGLIFLGYASMESVIFFNPNVQGMLVGILFFLPMINRYKHLKHHELADEIVPVEKPELMDEDLVTKSMAKVFMGLTVAACSLFAFAEVRNNEFARYLVLNLVLVFVLFALCFPFIISCQSMHKGRLPYIAVIAINATIVVGFFTFLVVRHYVKPDVVSDGAKWVYFILLAIVMVSEVLFLAIYKKKSLKDYLLTFDGLGKLSFMGIAGVALTCIVILFAQNKINGTPLTLIAFPVLTLVIFFICSYIIPFNDTKAIVEHYNDIAIHSLKREVVKDRLEAINDKRRD